VLSQAFNSLGTVVGPFLAAHTFALAAGRARLVNATAGRPAAAHQGTIR